MTGNLRGLLVQASQKHDAEDIRRSIVCMYDVFWYVARFKGVRAWFHRNRVSNRDEDRRTQSRHVRHNKCTGTPRYHSHATQATL